MKKNIYLQNLVLHVLCFPTPATNFTCCALDDGKFAITQIYLYTYMYTCMQGKLDVKHVGLAQLN